MNKWLYPKSYHLPATRSKKYCSEKCWQFIPKGTEHWDNLYRHRVLIERSIYLLKDPLGAASRKSFSMRTAKADLLLAGITQLVGVVLAYAINKQHLHKSVRKLVAWVIINLNICLSRWSFSTCPPLCCPHFPPFWSLFERLLHALPHGAVLFSHFSLLRLSQLPNGFWILNTQIITLLRAFFYCVFTFWMKFDIPLFTCVRSVRDRFRHLPRIIQV